MPEPQDQPVENAVPDQGDVTSPKAQPELDDGAKSVIDKERKLRKQADREKAELAAKLQAFEDRDKSEEQKRAEKLEAAEKRAAEAEARLRVAEQAAKSGVPAELLSGPGDDLEGFAARLKEWADASKASPTPKDESGPVPSNPGQPIDKESLPIQTRIAAAEKAGDKVLVSRLKAIQLGMAKPTN